MNGKELFEKLTDISDEFIISAQNTTKQKNIYFKYLVYAASFLIFISCAYFYNIEFLSNDVSPIEQSEKDSNLPMITLNTEISSGMGFEGYMAYDISELTNSNPWNEDLEITHLPVIENPNYKNQLEIIENPNYDLMQKKLIETATILGMDIENLEIKNDTLSEEDKQKTIDYLSQSLDDIDSSYIESLSDEYEIIYLEDNRVSIYPKGYFDIRYFYIEDENYYVMVSWDEFIQIQFKNAKDDESLYEYITIDGETIEKRLPYDFYYNNINNILENYSNILDMQNPTANIHYGDYNIYAQQSFSLSFFDTSDDIVNSILNYSFNQVRFEIYNNSQVDIINKDYKDLSNIMGMYPIISPSEAETLLKDGYYISTVSKEEVESKYIKDVELVYQNTNSSKVHIPYYKFYVELPEYKKENGLNTYGAYYVPAIESQYIENMPSVNDINFN